MFKKKGEQEGKAVGTLILVIALAMLLYVLFIPPEDRDILLNQNGSSNTLSTINDKLELLSENPGFVSREQKELTEHNMIPVNLYIKNEPKSLNIAQSISITKGLFSKSFPTLHFNIDKKDLSKVSLFFGVAQADGELRISVNGNQFYSETLSNGVKIIEIPQAFLVEKNNELVFSVSSPGLSFWSTNQYVLNDIGLKEEFELINSKEERMFNIAEVEKDSLQSATVQFFQVCNMKLPKSTVPLKVYFNDNPVPALSTMIRCTSTKQSFDLDINNFKTGQNKILFVLEEAGDFTLNELKVVAEAKQTDYPSYSFAVSKDQYDNIKSGNKKVQLEINLDDNKETKIARIAVNKADVFMQTKSSEFTYDLKDYIDQGSNFIRIVPTNDFAINGLKVTLQ